MSRREGALLAVPDGHCRQRIAAERYEGAEIAGALAVVRRGDRVLELGTGLGLVSAVIARNAAPAAVLTFEANPDLIPHIRALHTINEMGDRIELRNQVLMSAPDRPETRRKSRGCGARLSCRRRIGPTFSPRAC